MPLAVEARSLNYWTAREILEMSLKECDEGRRCIRRVDYMCRMSWQEIMCVLVGGWGNYK